MNWYPYTGVVCLALLLWAHLSSSGNPTMLTADSELVHPLRLRENEVSIRAIAVALSRICRYCGHTNRFYSVAEHSILLARWVAIEHPAWALEALLHDASEAYLGDVISPLKRTWMYWRYRRAEKRATRVIYAYFGVRSTRESAAYVHAADKRIYLDERQIRPPRPHGSPPWKHAKGLRPLGVQFSTDLTPEQACEQFIELFRELETVAKNGRAA